MTLNGTGFEIDISVPADSVESAAVKVAMLAAGLDTAKSAAVKAAEALRAGNVEYDEAAKTADRAAKSVESLATRIAAKQADLRKAMDTGNDKAATSAARALQRLNVRMEEAAKVAAEKKAALDAAGAALANLEAAETAAAAEATRFADAEKAANEELRAMQKAAPTGKVNEMAEGLGKLGGPLGTAGQRAFGLADAWKKLGTSMGAAGPYVAIAVALVAIVAGLAAIAAAAVVAAAKLLTFATRLADTARANRLLADGVARSVEGGKLLNDKLDELATKVPQTRDELLGMAGDLAKTGLRGAALADELEKAAVKAAELKWGPNFATQLLSLESQAKRFNANVATIFGGLNVDKLETGLARLVALFDANTASGKAMKTLFESIFQPLADNLGDVAVEVEKYFLLFEIQVLKLAIAIKPHASMILTLAKIFGVLALVIGGALAFAIGVVAVGIAMMAVAFGVLVAAVLAVVAGVVWLTEQFQQLSESAVNGVVAAFQQVSEYLSNISLSEIGANIIKGLADGILGGGAAVVSAITGVTGNAISAAKNALGIASPSKVFAEIGGYTSEGMVQGVEGGTADVQGAFDAMVAPPGPAGAPLASAAPSGGHTFQITIEAAGGDGKSIAAAVREVLLDILEGDVTQIGSAVPA